MAENPLRNVNKGLQTKSEVGDVKQSITLYDIDYAIMTYLEDVVLPTLDENGKAVKIPVIYGNSERWEGARKKGVYRDQKGRIQLPLMMLKRSSVAKKSVIFKVPVGNFTKYLVSHLKFVMVCHGLPC